MGITYKNITHKFSHDGVNDIIELTGMGHQVEAFSKCFYYGYEFSENVDGSVRSSFIKHLKFCPDLRSDKNLTQFIQKAINDLNRKTNLYDYDFVIMPEFSSRVNEYMVRYIYRFAQPMLREIMLVKSLPERIDFDMDAFSRQYLDTTLENGRPRYTESQKQQVIETISDMMDSIHKKDYFTIAKDVKKSKMRPFIVDFLSFRDEEDKKICKSIQNQNVLIIDDIATSGSTLNEVLRTLRILNENNNITIFSLIGRKDLMVESY